MRIIFVRHAQAAKTFAPFIQAKWPGETIALMPIVPNGLNKPVYPRGLAYSEYPMVLPSDYRPHKSFMRDGSYTCIYTYGAGPDLERTNLSFDEACTLLREASALTYLCEWDYTGAWGMDILLKHAGVSNSSVQIEVIRNGWGYTQEMVDASFAARRDSFDPEFQSLTNAGYVKRYFDFNFSMNSFVILSSLYRDVFGVAASDKSFFGRSGVLITMHAAEVGELPINLANYLQCWKGTGKYSVGDQPFFEGMGTSLSRQMVELDLERLNILTSYGDGVGDGYRRRGFRVTDLGREFASRLHKDCYDIDLPFRLNAWMGRPFDEVKPIIDRYILTYFRKQKRLQDG